MARVYLVFFIVSICLQLSPAWGKHETGISPETLKKCRSQIIKLRPLSISFFEGSISIPQQLLSDQDGRKALQEAANRIEGRLRTRMREFRLSEDDQDYAGGSLALRVGDLIRDYLSQLKASKKSLIVNPLVLNLTSQIKLSEAEWQSIVPVEAHGSLHGIRNLIGSDIVLYGLDILKKLGYTRLEAKARLKEVLQEDIDSFLEAVSNFEPKIEPKKNPPIYQWIKQLIDASEARISEERASRVIRDDPLRSFLHSISVLPEFSAAEEAEFFKELLLLEETIFKEARSLGTTFPEELSTRGERIRTLIFPLLKRMDEFSKSETHHGLHQKLKLWQEMRSEVVRRNGGLIASLVVSRSPPRVWSNQFADQLVKMNILFTNFEPSRGYKFSTYAHRGLLNGIHRSMNFLERPPYMSFESSKLVKKYLKLKQDIYFKEDRFVEAPEVAKALGLSINRAEEIIRLSGVHAVEVTNFSDDRGPLAGIISAPKKEAHIDHNLGERRKAVLQNLNASITDPKLRTAVEGILSGETNESTGSTVGANRETVRLWKLRAHRALKALIGIESNTISRTEDQNLLIDYFGFYNKKAVTLDKMRDKWGLTSEEIEDRVTRLLEEVSSEDFDLLLSADDE